MLKQIDYQYKPISVPGGGFVTGFVFHPVVPNILYCRTDIGGTYRFDFEQNTWISLIDHATDIDMWETYPLSIALDPQNPSYYYAMVGLSPVHKIAFSQDYGNTFTYFDSPVIDEKGNTAAFHGNAPGRSTGERLVVDPYDANILYMGTMAHGLFKTTDRCKTWTKLEVAASGKKGEENISFIELDCKSGSQGKPVSRLVVGTNGRYGGDLENVRGQSVYISQDGGNTFEPLKGEPAPVLTGPKDYPGYVGQRALFVDNFLYITYAAYNIGWSNWNSYGCDTGLCYDGALYRFHLSDDGKVVEALDISPKPISSHNEQELMSQGRRLGYGMSGISNDPVHKNCLIASTITAHPDVIYRSNDRGITWTPIMSGLEIGNIDFNVSYQKPVYNGNGSLIHWMADVKINPFNRDMALFNTGAGIFMTRDLTLADQNMPVTWACCNKGVEETVHLNIYSPPSGKVKLIDIIGDYGGFVFEDLDKPAENTFANANKDRWITGMNADFPDSNPNMIAVAPRGNWTGKTKGGLIITFDQGDHWEQLPSPKGLNGDIDELVAYFNTPNVTTGWVSVSADGETLVWGLGLPIYAHRHVYSHDLGKSWGKTEVYDLFGQSVGTDFVSFKVMADRVNPTIFYGFSDNSEENGFFVSSDKGKTFHQLPSPKGFPKRPLAGIDSEQFYEIRVESGKEGVIWFAMIEDGLWQVTYDLKNHCFDAKKVSKDGDRIKRIGIGMPEAGSNIKTLFTSGVINGIYGFYRSHDGGVNWIKINNSMQNYGDIRSITGDPRVFGRIYVATGTKGLVYGDPVI